MNFQYNFICANDEWIKIQFTWVSYRTHINFILTIENDGMSANSKTTLMKLFIIDDDEVNMYVNCDVTTHIESINILNWRQEQEG